MTANPITDTHLSAKTKWWGDDKFADARHKLGLPPDESPYKKPRRDRDKAIRLTYEDFPVGLKLVVELQERNGFISHFIATVVDSYPGPRSGRRWNSDNVFVVLEQSEHPWLYKDRLGHLHTVDTERSYWRGSGLSPSKMKVKDFSVAIEPKKP